jgi:selenocysteine lyase/cysteine desulfurase
MGVDFLAADGHKWMLAPEGCGIFYCRHDLVETLHPAVIGWMNMVDAANYGDYRFEFERDARRFEPGSYNIPGILALGAGIELLLEVGMDHVWSRIDTLTTRLCEGLAAKRYRVFSPRGDGQRSGIVSFDPPGRDPSNSASAKQIVADLQKLGIIIVMREGRLRASPHFYNTEAQIDRLIDALP